MLNLNLEMQFFILNKTNVFIKIINKLSNSFLLTNLFTNKFKNKIQIQQKSLIMSLHLARNSAIYITYLPLTSSYLGISQNYSLLFL